MATPFLRVVSSIGMKLSSLIEHYFFFFFLAALEAAGAF